MIEAIERRLLLSAGDLDLAFGIGGKATPDVAGPSIFLGVDQVVQPDGKVVIVEQNRTAANEYTSSARGLNIVRLLASGAVDTSFGTAGRIDFGGDARAVARQADGKILVAGGIGDAAVIARYGADGKPDATFGVGGRVTMTWSTSRSFIDNLVTAPDGALFVSGGYSGPPIGSFTVVARLTTAGTPDPTFGQNGIINFGSFDHAVSLVPTPDGGLLVGSIGDPGGAVSRYDRHGTLVPSFEGGGYFQLNFGSPTYLGDIVLQPDGRFLITAGTSAGDAIVARYTATGQLDTSFATAGVFTYRVDNRLASAGNLLLQSDGSMFVELGLRPDASSNTNELHLRKLRANGTPDTSFGSAGDITEVPVSDGWTSSLSLAPGGKILATQRNLDLATPLLQVVRRNLSGQVDPTFGAAGKVTFPTPVRQYATMIHQALQADGKTVAVGTANEELIGGYAHPVLARFTATGAADPTFGVAGRVIGVRGVEWNALAIQGDGKIVVAGSIADPNSASLPDLLLTRFNANGSIDSTFGQNGIIRKQIQTGALEVARAVTLLPGGKILVAAEVHPEDPNTSYTPGDLLFLRYNPSGTPDTTFGPAGQGWTRIDLGLDEAVRAMAVSATGAITAVGYQATVPQETKLMLALRLSSNGALDKAFGGGDGWTVWQWGEGITMPFDEAHALAVQTDGKILVAGPHFALAGNQFGLARLTAAGALDPTFGNAGLVKTPMGIGAIEANAVAISSDGRILVGGAGAQTPEDLDFALARYTPAGTLDATFGVGGKVFTSLGRTNERIVDLSLLPNNRILAGGTSFKIEAFPESRMAQVRYLAQDQDSLKDSVLTLVGTPGNDRITAALNAGRLIITKNGVQQSYLPWQVRKLIISGEAGNDALLLGAGVPDALIDGGTGNDSLLGGSGRDTLRGGDGKDDLRGGDGNDLIDGGAQADRISGGKGTDTVDFSARTVAVRVSLDGVWNDGQAGELDDVEPDVENVIGTPANDVLLGSAFNNRLIGLAGNDLIVGGFGNDSIDGGAGNDTLDGGVGNDTVNGGEGRDPITGGEGFDRLDGGLGDDSIWGGLGPDALTGGAGADHLWGDAGDDWLYARDSVIDNIDGGPGADRAQVDRRDVLTDVEVLLQ